MLQNQGSICHNSNNAKQEIHTKCSSLITCISLSCGCVSNTRAGTRAGNEYHSKY